MSSDLIETKIQFDLRMRALQRLTGKDDSHALDARWNSSAAFRVLHELASAPSTSSAALTLLHELQVYQVELELQDEELRRSRAEIEETLIRQKQLYDFSPVGCFTVDRRTALRELNLTGACMLGSERDQLLGRTLDSFLAPQSARVLNAMITGVNEGAPTEVGALQIMSRRDTPRGVHASACCDPDGENFLIAFVDAVGHKANPSG
jgi:nitrogen fixation/metabolism regulation signal transduction histidine kinase